MPQSRFIILADSPTATQQNAITDYLKKPEFGFWHHFPHSWLVINTGQLEKASQLRDEIHQVAPDLNILVYKVDDPYGWGAFGETGQFDWLSYGWLCKESPKQIK